MKPGGYPLAGGVPGFIVSVPAYTPEQLNARQLAQAGNLRHQPCS